MILIETTPTAHHYIGIWEWPDTRVTIKINLNKL